MKRTQLACLILFAIGSMLLASCSEKITEMNGGIEARYLPQIQADIKEIVGDFEPYGSIYIERTPLLSFVIAIAHPNEKTNQLKKRLSETIPSPLLKFKKVEFSFSELKARSMEITKKWDYYRELGADIQDTFVDEFKNNVGVTVSAISEQAKQVFLEQYGDKVSIVINAPNDFDITGYVVKSEAKRVLIVSNVAKYSSPSSIKDIYDAVWVTGIAEKLEIGQKVKVWFDGALAESDPAQGQSKKVEIITSPRPANANLMEAEVIRQALASTKIIMFVVKSIHYNEQSDAWTIQYKDGLFVSNNTDVKELQILDK